jgi:hypothetical protein
LHGETIVKLTTTRLKKIIKEELNQIKEMDPDTTQVAADLAGILAILVQGGGFAYIIKMMKDRNLPLTIQGYKDLLDILDKERNNETDDDKT